MPDLFDPEDLPKMKADLMEHLSSARVPVPGVFDVLRDADLASALEMLEDREMPSSDEARRRLFEDMNALAEKAAAKFWVAGWHALHLDMDGPEHESIAHGRAFLYNAGDCGNAWGEERTTETCPYHTVVYLQGEADLCAAVLRYMDDAARAGISQMAVTDPNDWSRDVVVVRDIGKTCPHSIRGRGLQTVTLSRAEVRAMWGG